MIILPFPTRPPTREHFTGYLFGRIRHIVGKATDAEAITIEHVANNHNTGAWQGRVTMDGDDNVYELVLRPVDRGQG